MKSPTLKLWPSKVYSSPASPFLWTITVPSSFFTILPSSPLWTRDNTNRCFVRIEGRWARISSTISLRVIFILSNFWDTRDTDGFPGLKGGVCLWSTGWHRWRRRISWLERDRFNSDWWVLESASCLSISPWVFALFYLHSRKHFDCFALFYYFPTTSPPSFI